ncbi:MAG: 2-oxo acid dehydrogenase subunit E2 [Flavobacteriales bacterium]|nr:2-oxo acid dehydrogenase subunit E2 [Flavobacteriales bacterium]
MAYELIMPKMGESIEEATIIRWLKEEGDSIAADEAVLEIATDKVDSEVPAPEAGVLLKKLFTDGDVVKVGAAIAQIGGGNESVVSSPATTSAPVQNASVPVAEKVLETKAVSAPVPVNGNSDRFYSPLVMNIARTEQVSMAELEQMAGTGQNGRVTKRDILAYISNRSAQPVQKQVVESVPVQTAAPALKSEPKAPAVSLNSGDEIIEMDRMRKLIADHMVMSKHTSPHVTSFVEADVTNIVNWRNKHKRTFEERDGEKLTFTPIFIEAIVKAIKDFPMINISVDGDRIIRRKQINIGMAAALPSGNLIVPVIRNADTMNLVGLARSVNDLANRARNNALKPDEIQGGTYTVTNVGTFGNVMGTPIINQPQVAIMATGAIRKKPAVIETEFGDMIGIRHMMFLSHSYDHRVVDGALGGMFVRRVADYLENWDMNREM